MIEDGIPRRTLAGLVFGTLVVAGGLAAAMVFLFRTADRDPQEVILAARQVMRQRFPQASEIRFAPVNQTHTERRGEDRYLVSGWMEVTNQDGERATFDFACELLMLSSGQWITEKVDAVPRP